MFARITALLASIDRHCTYYLVFVLEMNYCWRQVDKLTVLKEIVTGYSWTLSDTVTTDFLWLDIALIFSTPSFHSIVSALYSRGGIRRKKFGVILPVQSIRASTLSPPQSRFDVDGEQTCTRAIFVWNRSPSTVSVVRRATTTAADLLNQSTSLLLTTARADLSAGWVEF